MKKPADLRRHITTYLPDLNTDPERLRIWIEQGTVKTTQSANLNFELRYQLNIAIIDCAYDPLIAIALINDWLRTNQPDVVASQAASGYDIQVDFMTNKVVDLGFTLPLSEIILCRPRETGGGWEYMPRPETPSFDDDLMPDGQPIPRLREIWWGGEKLVPDPATQGGA